MSVKVDLEKYPRRYNFERFLNEGAGITMCVTGKFDITKIVKKAKKGHSLNALILFCIQNAGQRVPLLHYDIRNENELWYSENVSTNSVVKGSDGANLYFVSYEYNSNFEEFEKNYFKHSRDCSQNNKHRYLLDYAQLSTSAMVEFPFESITCAAARTFSGHFLMWGAYRKHFTKKYLNITLRFHHSLIDGEQAATFFKYLQEEFNKKI